MLRTLLLIGLVPFLLALFLHLPSICKALADVRGRLFWLGVAWSAMFIGQGQLFAHSQAIEGAENLSTGAYYQLVWMAFAAFILLIQMVGFRLDRRVIRLPLVMMGIYAFLGIATAGFSPSPLLSVYKASQLLLDFVLIAVSGYYLIEHERPRLIPDLTVFLLMLVILGAAVGGVFMPDQAFKSLYGGGTFGHTLRGVVPQVHSNELGLLSAALVIIALIRGVELGSGLGKRFYWLSLCLLSFVVLVGAQARTSIFSLSLALIIMFILVPRLRWLLFLMFFGGAIIVSWYFVTNGSLGIEDALATYLRRGSTDQQLQSLSGRTDLWEAGWRMVKASPLIGHGFQAGARLGGLRFGIPEGMNMHSGHMQVLVDSGITGYIAWLMFVVPMIWMSFRQFVQRHIPIRAQDDRYHLEAFLVMFVIFFRSFLGQVMVTHQFSTMLYLAMYLYVVISSLRVNQKRAT